MKRVKWYFLISIAVLLTAVCAFLCEPTIYSFHNGKDGMAGAFATLLGVLLTIILQLWTYILKKFPKRSFIERYLNDEHFVDRENEYAKLFRLIQCESTQLIYINGKSGMGKTLFTKMSCDRINFFQRKKWKSYAAFYYNNQHTQTITQALAKKYCDNPDASVPDISKKLHGSTFQKNTILFIDNIYEMDLNECIEFANAFVHCTKTKSNYVIIAVTSNDEEFQICPGEFGEKEIELLANSYDIEIPKNDRQEMSELSNGYPVYARYSVEAYAKGIKIADYRNLENYFQALIGSLDELEKRSLSLIICLSQLLQDEIEINVIYGIDNQITRLVINRLATHSLINKIKGKIYTDKLVSLKCMEFLSEYKNESYHQIYQYYIGLPNMAYIALVAALKSNFKYDNAVIKKVLHKQYKDNNFYILIELGELEFNGLINPYLREDTECWIYVRYYYLKSLLELGLYDKAREVVDASDNSFNLLNINTDIDFEYQYLLVDLDHLTNYLEDAICFSSALSEKASTPEQWVKCQYLYAHCLRHVGKDLNQAFDVFSDLAKATDYKDDKIRIRSIYSAASIKLFQGDRDYDYDGSFEKIKRVMYSDAQNVVWKPYVIRHKALYEYKIRNNFKDAEKMLREAISLLEVTPLRIKYDIYFELAEIYRIYDNHSDNYDKSLSLYQKAEQFASRVHDYNLQSSSQLGMMLLNIKYDHPIKTEDLKTILEQTHKMDLNINYNYAMYVKYAFENEAIPKELTTYWKNMQYADLLSFSCKSIPEKYNLKLTVM